MTVDGSVEFWQVVFPQTLIDLEHFIKFWIIYFQGIRDSLPKESGIVQVAEEKVGGKQFQVQAAREFWFVLKIEGKNVLVY